LPSLKPVMIHNNLDDEMQVANNNR
jgi:hypothetical protein